MGARGNVVTGGKTGPFINGSQSGNNIFSNLGFLFAGNSIYSGDGSPNTPCLKMARGGKFSFLWPVVAGARSLSISCKIVNASGIRIYSSLGGTPDLRPRIIIDANEDIAVVQKTVYALDQSGWQSVAISIAPLVNGVVRVTLYAPNIGLNNYVLWDTPNPS